MTINNEQLTQALIAVRPWLDLYRGRVFVLKLGGELLDDQQALQSTVEQIALLSSVGIKVVVVHGGGNSISRLQNVMGIDVQQFEGRRITDDDTLKVAIMALNGTMRTRLLSAFQKAGASCTGICGLDEQTLVARRRAPTQDGAEVQDWGHVGDIQSVNPHLISSLLERQSIVVLSPLCGDGSGRALNVNADTVAAVLAHELQATKLLLITSSGGILRDHTDSSTLIPTTDLNGLDRLEEDGAFKAGMHPKISATRYALEHGVPRVHIVGYHISDSLLLELFTNEGSGTLVVSDTDSAFAGTT